MTVKMLKWNKMFLFHEFIIKTKIKHNLRLYGLQGIWVSDYSSNLAG